MLEPNQPASGDSLHDLRQRVLQGLPCRAEVLVNMIDALSVGPRPATPSELVFSPLWGYASSTLYAELREGAAGLVGAVGCRAAGSAGRRGRVAGENLGRDQL